VLSARAHDAHAPIGSVPIDVSTGTAHARGGSAAAALRGGMAVDSRGPRAATLASPRALAHACAPATTGVAARESSATVAP
jgi:hypothetical protein